MTEKDKQALDYCFQNCLEAIKMGNYEGHFFSLQQMAKISLKYSLPPSPSRH
jgi:hypothetical protein